MVELRSQFIQASMSPSLSSRYPPLGRDLSPGTEPVWRAPETSGGLGTKEELWPAGCHLGLQCWRWVRHPGSPQCSVVTAPAPRTPRRPRPVHPRARLQWRPQGLHLGLGDGSGVWVSLPSPVSGPHTDAGSRLSLGPTAQRGVPESARGHVAQPHRPGSEWSRQDGGRRLLPQP